MPIFVYPEYATDADYKQAMDEALVRKQKLEQLIEESRFAKIVSTGQGNALLIGGNVIHVVGEDPELLVEAISIALRQRPSGGLAGQDYSTAVSRAEEDYRASVAGYGLAGYGMHGNPIRG